MRFAIPLALVVVLAACGESKFDRGVSGAAGVLSDEDDVDLGDPLWRR